MSKLTISQLKNELKNLDQKQLIQLLTDVYKLNDDVKIYITKQFKGEEALEELYEVAKKKIKAEFFPSRGDAKLRLKEAKNAIAHFKKLSDDALKTLDLMLYYVEMGTAFTNMFGDIDSKFYQSLVTVFQEVVIACASDEAVYKQFEDRLLSVAKDSEGIGWGYADAINELYNSIEWVWEEE